MMDMILECKVSEDSYQVTGRELMTPDTRCAA